MTVEDDGFELNPPVVKEFYTSSLEQVIEFMRAAEVLSLGIRVANHVSPDGEPGSYSDGWDVMILADTPLRPSEDTA